MTKWQELKLGNVVEIRRGASPRPIHHFLSEAGMPWVKIADATSDDSRYITHTNEYIKEEGVAHSVTVEPETLIVSNSATPGLPKIMQIKACVHDGWLVFSNYKGIIRDFLYYKFKEIQRSLVNQANGSVFQNLKTDIVREFPIYLPPLEIQKKIAGVLGALDDKIELNNKINNNLEQQAQALFNEKIVNNSKQGCIGDYCSIKSGFAFKSSWWQNTGVRVIKIKNIEPSGLNLQECSFVSEDKVSIAKEFIVKGGDLLIAMTGATIGKFAIVPHVDEILLVNQRVGKFFLGDNPLEKLPFIYCTLKQPEVVSEIINRGQGSAQPNISGNDIMSITCTYPDENIIAGFNNICRPYFEKIITNQYENTRLAAIRDALLPKLMSGEIDVSNVDISALTSTDKLSFSEE